MARIISPALVARTEAFVRDVLINCFHQETTDREVRDVARQIINNFPDSVKYRQEREA